MLGYCSRCPMIVTTILHTTAAQQISSCRQSRRPPNASILRAGPSFPVTADILDNTSKKGNGANRERGGRGMTNVGMNNN